MTTYGKFGWKELLSRRLDILDAFDQAKRRNISRPVQTEHGVAGEAEIRQWLSNFLPSKYGVTSGYIVPDILPTDDYSVLSYDIIIFDRASAPVLWIDANVETSEPGKKRAIPAQHVLAVVECKASFTPASIRESLAKLAEMNAISSHLHKHFWSAVMFMEVGGTYLESGSIIKKLIPDMEVHGYIGGAVLRCTKNTDSVGIVDILDRDKSRVSDNPRPIAIDLDRIPIVLNGMQLTLGKSVPERAGARMYAHNGGWHGTKFYICQDSKNDKVARITWSRSGFSDLCLDILSRLDGDEPDRLHDPVPDSPKKAGYGHVFDVPLGVQLPPEEF